MKVKGGRNPFAELVDRYRAGGWEPFPLPYGEKGPPPSGVTGANGRPYSGPEPTEPSNIGLRMPPGVIAIDVDPYHGGEETLLQLAKQYGRLPRTYIQEARGTHLFFRVPADRRWVGQLGPGIEVVQRRHRYVVAAPSLHPDGETVYRWAGPDGQPCDPPAVANLPELPAPWMEALTSGPDVDAEPRSLPGATAGHVRAKPESVDLSGSTMT